MTEEEIVKQTQEMTDKFLSFLKDNKDQSSIFYNVEDFIETEFFSLHPLFDYYSRDPEILQLVSEIESKFKVYKYETWMCTDTLVGYFLYTFDDELIAFSEQIGRKWDTNYFWIDDASHQKIYEYFLSIKKNERKPGSFFRNWIIARDRELKKQEQVKQELIALGITPFGN